MSKLYERLRKIYALSKRGIDGEKLNAEILLKRIMEKHGITIDEITQDEKRVLIAYYYCKQSESILSQIMFMVNNDDRSVKINRKRKCLITEVSKYEEIRILELFEWHWSQYKKERLKLIRDFNLAYLSKHNLFSDSKDDESNEFDLDQLLRIEALANAMENISPTKALNKSNSKEK